MTLQAFQSLLAVGVGDVLVGLVAIIIVIVRQLLEANKNAGNRAKLAAMQKQPQPLPADKPAAAGQQADPLRAQVEEFLRRAGRPAQQNQPRSQQGRPSEIEVLVQPVDPTEARSFGQPLRQADWRQAVGPPPSPPAEKSRFAKSKRKRQSVAEHVAEQVTSRARSMGAQASQLGQRIAVEDEQFDVQLKAKFDHTVGTLAGSDDPMTEPVVPRVETPASQLAAMLANPVGIRQAVLVNEILRRPSDRW